MSKVKSNKKSKEKSKKEDTIEDKGYKKNPLTVKFLPYAILISIFFFSFYIRGIMPLKSVFSRGIVGFAADDSVFHMRLVENTIQFFPHRIFYDAYTLYPYGTPLHWGPLFDQTIAFFALVAGFIMNGSMPSQSTIDTVGAFYPAVLGALVVFPVYFIGKELADEKAGLLGAFLIAILPGQFFFRSVLGFTDNHVAEVFYLTLMMMFFMVAIKRSKSVTFDHWLQRDWSVLKPPITYSVFAGISFGGYLLNWTAGVFFAVVFGIFLLVQHIIDHLRGKPTEYLGVVGIIAYLTAMIMVLPYVEIGNGFSSGYYSLLHLAVTGGGAAVFASLSIVSREMNRRKLSRAYYLLFVSGAILIGLIVLKVLVPGLYNASVGNWDYIFHGQTGGGLTIAEAYPITDQKKLEYFGYNYYLAYIGILILGYYIIKKPNAEYTLVAIWSIFVWAILQAQDRFAYYYAVNVAILVSFAGSKVLDFVDWKGFGSGGGCVRKIKVQHVISLSLVIAVTAFMGASQNQSPFNISTGAAQLGPMDIAHGYYEWYDALNWMRYNTPDPGLSYYAIYKKPENGTYPYPENAYGVMSWWDYGHVITYWGHRIPNANPFQQGIGGGPAHAPGASTFLTAQTEEEANKILDKLGTGGKPGARYIVSSGFMAYSIQEVFAMWNESNVYGDVVSLKTGGGQLLVPGKNYYDTMESRLHILDARGLKHYRLIHESLPNPNTLGGYLEAGIYNEDNKIVPVCDWNLNLCVGKYWYNLVYNESIPIEYTGYVKIFEYVKGAKITGRAPPYTAVTLTNTIKTNIGRTIQYSQITSSDGAYEFTVPYSTGGSSPGGTNFDTQPTGPYTVTAGNISKQVNISEEDILQGGIVALDLI